jgi:hypothetical protein
MFCFKHRSFSRKLWGRLRRTTEDGEDEPYTYEDPYSRIVFMPRVVQRRQFGIDSATNGDGSNANFSRDRAARKRHGYAHGYDRSNDFARLYALEQWLWIRSRIRKFVDPNERPVTCSS